MTFSDKERDSLSCLICSKLNPCRDVTLPIDNLILSRRLLGHPYLHQVPFAWWANKKKREKEKRNCDNLGPDCDLTQNFTPDIGHSELELQRGNKNAIFAVNFWSLLFGMEKISSKLIFSFMTTKLLSEKGRVKVWKLKWKRKIFWVNSSLGMKNSFSRLEMSRSCWCCRWQIWQIPGRQ